MPFDGFVLSAICGELAEKITGCAIDRVYQPAAEAVVLNLRQGRDRWRLFLSAHATGARAHLLTEAQENPPSPPFFCLVLRKHLEGGRIRSVRQPGLDRVLVLDVEAREETGALVRKRLVCEIMGKHSNIILLDSSGQVIDAVKRYSHLVSRYREVLPGRPYLPPPPQNKLNPLVLQEEEFVRTLLALPLELPLKELLPACLDGFSKTLAAEVVYRAGLPGDTVLNVCGEYELKKLWQALQELAVPAREGKFDPTLLANGGRYVDFAAFDLTHLAGLTRQKGEMNVLVEKFYTQKERGEKLSGEKEALLKVVHKELKRLQKKLRLYEEEVRAAKGAEEYKLYGELLLANLHRLERGVHEAALENYYDPQNKVVRISLDPGLSPLENALAFFKKYNKARVSRQKAREFITEIDREITYLGSVETNLQQAGTLDDLFEIKEELAEQGYLPRREKEKRKTPAPSPELLTFTSSDGFTILVGRNNKQNDYLTMRLARKNDVWLHARDVPGAHVVIRTEGRLPPTPLALQEAAALAAYFSRARHSQNVPVDYTLRKNVSKPGGTRPGFVVYKEQRTINVNPAEELVERLRTNREGQKK